MRLRITKEIDYIYCPTCKNKLTYHNFDKQNVLACNLCSFTFWNNPQPVVSALIEINGKVLLIKRKGQTYNGFWAMPGGIINSFEEPSQSIKREVKEECGLTVTDLDLLDAYLIIYAPNGLNKKPSHTSIDLIYKCGIKEKSIKKFTSNEVSKVALFNKETLPENIAFKHREMIYKHYPY